MNVTSDLLERMAAEIRGLGLVYVPELDRKVSAKQLDTAAELIRSAEKCSIRTPRRYAGEWDRPAYLEADDDLDVIRLQIGLFGATVHRIDRKGTADPGRSCL